MICPSCQIGYLPNSRHDVDECAEYRAQQRELKARVIATRNDFLAAWQALQEHTIPLLPENKRAGFHDLLDAFENAARREAILFYLISGDENGVES